MAGALEHAGLECVRVFGRGDELSEAASIADVVVIATPDASIIDVARVVRPVDDTVVLHLSGATPLVALEPHPRRGGLHPLAPLSGSPDDAATLRSCWYGVAGDPVAEELATALSGNLVHIADEDRALYHAAAAVASNHTTAIIGQAERLAASVGLPMEALAPLVRASIEAALDRGAADALTGPVARGDQTTIEGHRAAIGRVAPDELAGYDAVVELARRLAGSESDPAH